MVGLSFLPCCAILLLILGTATHADVRLPIKATLDLDKAVPAVAGQNYLGTLRIATGLAGELNNLALEGEGCDFEAAEFSGPVTVDVGDVVPIDFVAITGDANKPFTATFTIDGLGYRKSFDVSLLAFERTLSSRCQHKRLAPYSCRHADHDQRRFME